MPRVRHAPLQSAHVAAYSKYSTAAKPFFKPIKGVKFRLPDKIRDDPREEQQLGALFEDMHPAVPDNGRSNFLAAFRKRCNYFSAKRASPAIIDAAQKFAEVLVPKPLRPFQWNQMLFDEWLVKFGEEKRARMVTALESINDVTLKDYIGKQIFVKVENLLVQHKPNWAPRVIFKSHDLMNALAGPVFNELLSRLDACCNHMQGKYQFKLAYKKVPTDYTDFISTGEGEYVECDFSSNDKLQCSDVMVLEMALMRRLGAPEWFIRLHALTNEFTVKSLDHGLKATLENMMPTGCPDTTFRNCFWNMCILYAFLTRVGATRCRAVILGDDMLAKIAGLRRYAAKTYNSIAAEAQMEAKAFRYKYLLDCSFVSRLFVPAGAKHLTVPIIGKALARFNMRANFNTSLTDDQYMAGKSIGGAYEFRHLEPIRDAFIVRFDHHWQNVLAQRQRDKHLPVELSWNAKSAGVTLKNIRDKIFNVDLIPELDFHGFCYHRYGFGSDDVISFCEDVILTTEKVDLRGTLVDVMARDFL